MSAGKGDKMRPTDWKAYRDGMDRIFGKKKSDKIGFYAIEAPIGNQQLNETSWEEEIDGEIIQFMSWEDENGNRTVVNVSALKEVKCL